MKICPVAVSFLAGIFQMYALPLRLPQSLTEGGAGSWFIKSTFPPLLILLLLEWPSLYFLRCRKYYLQSSRLLPPSPSSNLVPFPPPPHLSWLSAKKSLNTHVCILYRVFLRSHHHCSTSGVGSGIEKKSGGWRVGIRWYRSVEIYIQSCISGYLIYSQVLPGIISFWGS